MDRGGTNDGEGGAACPLNVRIVERSQVLFLAARSKRSNIYVLFSSQQGATERARMRALTSMSASLPKALHSRQI